MSAKKSPFLFNCYDLPRRAGEMREFELNIDAPDDFGLPLFKIDPATPIEVDLTISAVSEGVLATAEVRATAHGECTRCLEPIEQDIDQSFTELFYYQTSRPSRSKAAAPEELGEDDNLVMDGDEIDLELPVRDALILNLPLNPLCRPDCQGLCPDCGVKWDELPGDHGESGHDKTDIRWAGLEKLHEQMNPGAEPGL